MRIFYTSAAVGAAVGIGVTALVVLGWKRKDSILLSVHSAENRAKSVARSAWGRVSSAASNLIHTERAPGEVPSTDEQFS